MSLQTAAEVAQTGIRQNSDGIAEAISCWPGRSRGAMKALGVSWDASVASITQRIDYLGASVSDARRAFERVDDDEAATIHSSRPA
ncbi:hypothetical protein [Williamsia soli]|uniref:hypothetical protein n=1 Tax=Williamsia soli TaxID=364929 RepID=UPI001A9E8083|nr:hypothetical protein [Williamsia soli]